MKNYSSSSRTRVVLGNAAGPENSMWKVIANNSYILAIYFFFFLCPQLWRSCRSILVSDCPSVHQKPCMLGFWNSYMDSSWKNSWRTFFFLVRVISLSRVVCTFENIQMKSDACHILWTVPARVLKFHIWIPHGKIADRYFFSCPSYLLFWSYAPLKKTERNLVSKISRNVFELGAWNLVSL